MAAGSFVYFYNGNSFVRAEVNPKFEDLIYFTNDSATVQLPPSLLLPLFLSV
jgi:hypothetical protein